MEKVIEKLVNGHKVFKEKYQRHDNLLMKTLAVEGQKPKIMVVACCDSRVDPALWFQCEPGDLFVVRNIANIIPPFQSKEYHHGTSAALEFACCFLKVQHLIILGHSQCAGIRALRNKDSLAQNDFITDWISQVELNVRENVDLDLCAQMALNRSFDNCQTYPWIKARVDKGDLKIHRWFCNIESAELFSYSDEDNQYKLLRDA